MKNQPIQKVQFAFPRDPDSPNKYKKPYRIKNMYNYSFQVDTDPEMNNDETVTVPGESLTIREIFKKYTSGLPSVVEKLSHFDDDPSFDDYDMNEVQNMDIFEKEQLLKDIDEQRKFVEKSIEDQRKKDEEEEEKRSESKDDVERSSDDDENN